MARKPTVWDAAPRTPIDDVRATLDAISRRNPYQRPSQTVVSPNVYHDMVTAQVRLRTGGILIASTHYAQLERVQKYEVRCELCGFIVGDVIPDQRAADRYGDGVDHAVSLINRLVGKFRCLETHRRDRMLLQILKLTGRKLKQIPDDVAMVAGDAYQEGMGSSNAITRLDDSHLVRVVALVAPHGYTREQDVADMYRHLPNPGIFELHRLLSGGRTVARGGEQATQQETDQYLEMRLWCVTDAWSRSRLPFERPVCPTREHQQIVEMSGNTVHSRPEVRMLIERAKRLQYVAQTMGRDPIINGRWTP